MLMAVQETASSTGSGRRAGRKAVGGETRRVWTGSLCVGVPVLQLAAWMAMGVPMVAGAQIVADPNAGASRPGVVQTANGLPQVNITRPSGAGVSVNHYNQFDVNKAGAILNNSPGIVATQQAGYINGNPNLQPGGSARIIVNQVTSTLPSQLRGYLEVAGPRAEVIVANPNGILVDGAGFINTSRATLTTGIPVYGGSGSLDAFRVTGGQILVEGGGLHATGVDQVDLIARAVKANAALYANNLNVVAGAAQVDRATLSASAIAGSGPAPSVGIDVSELGGMYANKILLASTEAGVGVSTRGVVAAQAGDLTLTAQGRLQLAGQTNTTGAMTVSARDGVDNSGTTYAGQRLALGTQGALTNSGTLAAGGGLSANAASIASSGTLASGVGADGTVSQAGTLALNASGAVQASGKVLAGADATVQGGSVNLAGSETSAIGAVQIKASQGEIDLHGATLSAGGALGAHASGALDASGATLRAGGSANVTAASVSNRNAQLIADGAIDIRSAGAVDNAGGVMQAGGGLSMDTASLGNQAGRVVSLNGDDLTIAARGTIENTTGTTASGAQGGVIGGNGSVRIDADVLVNHGQINAGSGAKLHVDRLDNDAGAVIAGGAADISASGAVSNRNGMISSASVDLNGGTIDNRGGRIEADGLALRTTGDLNNAGGTIAQYGPSDTTIVAGGTLDNTGGSVAINGSGGTLDVGTLTNKGGKIAHAGAGRMTVLGERGAADNTDGSIQSNGTIDARLLALDNTRGVISAQGDVSLVAGNGITNHQGAVYADKSLSVGTLRQIDNAAGSLQAGGDLTLSATGVLSNNGGTISANGADSTVSVTAAGVDNTGGRLTNAGAGATSVSTAGSLNNTGGTLGGNGNTTLAARDLINTGGGNVAGGGSLTLSVSNSVDNRGGRIYGGQALTMQQAGAYMDNSDGTLLGGKSIALNVSAMNNLGGSVRANQDIGVGGALAGSGEMTAGGNLSLDVNGDYVNDAANRLAANGDLRVTATGAVTNTGRLAAREDLTVQGSNVVNAAGATMTGATTNVSASGTISNAGRIDGDAVMTNSAALGNTGTIIGNAIQVQASDVSNAGAAAIIAGASDVKIYASNAVSNTDGATIYSMGNLQIARDGTRDGGGMPANQMNALVNSSATIEADGDIDIAARSVVNKRTSIVTEGGTPVETARQTLTAWMAGFEGDGRGGYNSLVFPQWRWNSNEAPISADMMNALRNPITVEVPKSDVVYVDTSNKTLSFSKAPIDQYEGQWLCPENGDFCGNLLVDRNIASNPVQYYQAIEDTGAGYKITFWPNWNPATQIRPDQQIVRYDLGPDVHDYSEIARTTVTMTATDRLISATDAGKIQARGAIRINADGGAILNQSSTMAAGGNLSRRAAGGTIDDVGTVLQQTVTTTSTSTFYWHQKSGGNSDQQTVVYAPEPQAPTTVAALPSVVTSNQTVQTSARDVSVGAVNAVGVDVSSSGVAGGGGSGAHIDGAAGKTSRPQTLGTASGGIPNLHLPTNGLYIYRSAPGDTYLVATDSRFTQYNNFISSDYMLGALGLDPQRTQKRLGDGFYEEKLIRDQVTALTGKTFLTGYTDQMEEYKALMNNGVTYGKAFGLAPGVGLTEEQMRQLTTDMVWMVSQDVTLPDGTTQSVLVPKVYLAQGPGVDLNATGALVAGNAVAINATGNVNNSGNIVGDVATQVLGTDIVNRGAIGGTTGTTLVQAAQDVRNLGGRIGGQDVVVAAGRDVINETQTISAVQSVDRSSASATAVGGQAVIEGKGNVAVLAGRDVTLAGSTLAAGGDALIGAGRDINMGTVALGTTQDTRNGQSYSHDAATTYQGSDVTAGKGLTAVAGRDVVLANAAVSAGTDATLVAGQNLVVLNTTDSQVHAEASLGGKSASYTKSSYDETVRGSEIEAGGNAKLAAGQTALVGTVLAANGIEATQTSGAGSVAVIGSSVTAGTGASGGGVTMVATEDVIVAEGREVHASSAEQRSRSSGFLSRSSSHDAIASYADVGVGSAISGNTVQAVAGNDLLIRQSTVTATDAVDLTAARGNVVITAGENVREVTETHERSSSGVKFSAGQGGIGVSAGSSNAKSSSHTVAVTQSDARSAVGATNGSVTITAGKDAVIIGSDLIAGRSGDNESAGHIDIQAENIAITTGIDRVVQDSSQSSKSSSFGVAVVGTPLDSVRNIQANSQADSKVTATKQVAGEIGHSAGTAPQIAVTYGRNSSSAEFHSESLTNSGSTLTGAGDIILRATGSGAKNDAGKALDGDILLHGGMVSAGGKAVLDAQRNVNIEASTDTYSESSSSQSSGWKISTAGATLGDIGRSINGGANSSGVTVVPYGSQKANSSSELSASQQNASTITGDSVTITSRTGDVRIAGSGVAAEHDIAISAKQGRVDILSGQETKSQRSDSSSKAIGDLGGNGYAGTFGVRSESHHLDANSTSENTVRSQVVSDSGNVSITAKDDLTARGADISAGQDVTLIGKNVVLDPGEDSSTMNQKDKSSQYGVTLAFSGYSVQAAQAAENAARAMESGDGKSAALYAVQAGIAAANSVGAVNALQGQGKPPVSNSATGNPGNSNGGGSIIKATVSIGGGSQQAEVHNAQSSSQGTTVNAGGSVNIIAAGSGAKDAEGYFTDGDINARGAEISGKNVALTAARDINLESAQDAASQNSKSSGSNASIGVGLSLGGTQNGFTIELAAAQNKAKADGTAVTNQNTHVTAGDTLTIASGRDTNLKGATATGDTIKADIGRDLNIESRQDTDDYHSRESSSGMQASICVPPICYGTTVSASGSVSSGKTDSTYASVVEQTGLYAGKGGFDINVEGNTDLKGAVIASTADKDKNTLTTGTLTTSDIENKAEYKSDTSTIAGSFTAGSSVPASNPMDGPVQQAHTNWGNTDVMGAAAATAIATLAGNSSAPIKGNAAGTTRSAIAEGTVTITDAEGQKARTGKTAEETIASLNRDTENANKSVGKIFDAEKIKEQQAYDQLKQQTLQQAAPYLYDVVGDQLKGAPEPVKVAVHGLIGGLVSKALGGEFGSGAAGVAAATAAIMLLDENMGSLGVEPGTRDKMLQVVGMAIAKIVGGNATAATAGMADAYNRQLHPEERDLAKRMAANSNGKYTVDEIEAQMRLSNRVDMSGKVVETGGPDQINAATTKPTDDGAKWISVAGTTQIREIPAQANAEIIAYIEAQQKLALGDVPYETRQDYSSVPKISYTTPLPTARCGSGQADCVAGLAMPYGSEELARRRQFVADAASNFGTQAGRVGAISGAVAGVSSANPLIALPAGAFSYAMTGASLIAGGIEQVARPDVGQYTAESTLATMGFYFGERYPVAGPVINEMGEAVKSTDSMGAIKTWINDKWNGVFQK
ncbi:filamentous hemagglutinin [Cupriavidus sp. OV038]|uniref:hemagglutinin repeat-containing protein n=2 Tax=unclassified Cupriavidus TaxID=2640874 RepID=UPI0008F20796|nr:filamentous hemagglutinin [Cupriavidus sp. OV038]SFP09347.1 filamentous hemagglutinin [Cupriavidus sp. OV096]